jgi:hypothetical protein
MSVWNAGGKTSLGQPAAIDLERSARGKLRRVGTKVEYGSGNLLAFSQSANRVQGN